jgi:hypothetical protein
MEIDNITIKISNIKEIIESEIKKIIPLIINTNNNVNNLNNNLLNNYEFDISIIKKLQEKEIEKKKRPINPINFCLARKPNLNQCTRNKKNGCDFCANHQFYHPFGRIDEKYEYNINIKDKIKEKTQKRNKQNNNNIIQLSSKIINNQEYFIDNKNYIYIIENDGSKIKYKYIGIFNDLLQKIELNKN